MPAPDKPSFTLEDVRALFAEPYVLEDLQRDLSGKEIDKIFDPIEVRLIDQEGPDEKTVKALIVKIKNRTKAAQTCYATLGFDVPHEFEIKSFTFESEQEVEKSFKPPDHWLEGPRWVLVLISLENVTETDLTNEIRHKVTSKRTKFSLNPMVVPRADKRDDDGEEA